MSLKFKFIFIVVLAIVAGGLFYFFNTKLDSRSSMEYTIILDKDGFKPASLTIEKGDTVVFKSTSGKQFWPASDLHPSHTIYPEFDPKMPIEASDSWSFKFNKVGEWGFHDHLWSVFKGKIIVKDRRLPEKLPSVTDCKNDPNKSQCWQKLMNTTLDSKGLNAAFELLANLYSTESTFAQDCHSYTHELGISAYYKYHKEKAIDLSAKSYFCGYGFYHGFMETLLHTGGTIQEARDFCAYVGKTLAEKTSDAEGACYHGIGHGTVDGGDPTAWGDPQRMIDPGLKMCEIVSDTLPNLYRCVTGVYNATEILSADPKYKISMMQDNPFRICESQKEDYKEPCYTNMLPILERQLSEDFALIEKKIEKIHNKDNETAKMLGLQTKQMVTLSLFYDYVRANFQKPDYNINKGLEICRSISFDVHLACVEGLAGSFMKYGEPGSEYIKGLAFCGSSILNNGEKEVCYRHILNRLRIWYTSEKAKNICDQVDSKYRNYCSL